MEANHNKVILGSLNVEEVQTKDRDHLEHLDLLATVAGVELPQVTPSKRFNLKFNCSWGHSCHVCA